MRADTQIIDRFGRAGTRQSAELDAVAAAVSMLPLTAAAPVFGAVGARFLAALADAAAQQAADVTVLARRVDAGAAAAPTTARAYTGAEIRVRRGVTAPVADLEG